MSSNADIAKQKDAWYTVIVVDRIAIPLTKIAAKTAITPNQVTLLSFVLKLVAIGLAWADHPWWAVLLWQVGFWFDCVDGKLARLKKQYSLYGKILDQWGDLLATLGLLSIIAIKRFLPGDPLSAGLLFAWFILWVVNWFQAHGDEASPTDDTQHGIDERFTLLRRYARWAAKHRLKLVPITGVEEYTLLIPVGYALDWLPLLLPALVAYRTLALGARMFRRHYRRIPTL